MDGYLIRNQNIGIKLLNLKIKTRVNFDISDYHLFLQHEWVNKFFSPPEMFKSSGNHCQQLLADILDIKQCWSVIKIFTSLATQHVEYASSRMTLMLALHE